MSSTPDARLREVMDALVTHLHAFVLETRPAPEEFEQAVAFVTRLGQLTNDTHNEVVLFFDAIGVSTLICLLNGVGAARSQSALLGPFYRAGAPAIADGGTIVGTETPGPALFVELTVRDDEGRALPDADVEVWQASPVGEYDNQADGPDEMNLRGRFTTGPDGRVSFWTVRPSGYPVPTHGVVGDLLRAQRRHPYRPAHLHFIVAKARFRALISQVFVGDDPYLETDVVFGVTRPLVGDFIEHRDRPKDARVTPPWFSLAYEFVLTPGETRLPVPPIK